MPGDGIAGNGGGAGVDNQEGGATSGDRATGPTIAAATPGEHQDDGRPVAGGCDIRRAGRWYLVTIERAAASFLT